MSDPIAGQSAERRKADGPYGRALLAVSQGLAIAGGLVFVGLVVMSIVSIVGRKLASSPVPGDVEVLQMCAAFAAASFFAYCHLIGGDVKVDFFTANARARTIHWLDMFGSLLVGVVGALLAWRTFAGAMVVKEAGERSMILDWPLWIPQMAMVPGFALLALAGFYKMTQHLRAALSEALA
jgi:TRAP-type C4-dicarboxylate transport system permease small subunit